MEFRRLDNFVTLRARRVRFCPKPSVVLGYEPTYWANSGPATWISFMSSDGGGNRTINYIVNRLANRSGGISPVTLSDGARPLWPDRGMTWTIGSSSVGASEFDFSNLGNWFAPDAVPEPSVALLGSIAMVGMLFRRRK